MDRTDIRIIIGKNIRHRRLLAGFSLKALGKELGITYQQMQKYETGANGINCEKLIELAALFQCTVDDLCKDAIEITDYNPESPWNPYRVHTLISHFNRMRSHAARNKICGIVRLVADSLAHENQETL